MPRKVIEAIDRNIHRGSAIAQVEPAMGIAKGKQKQKKNKAGEKIETKRRNELLTLTAEIFFRYPPRPDNERWQGLHHSSIKGQKVPANLRHEVPDGAMKVLRQLSTV